MTQHDLYHHYLCREVPENYVSIVCQEQLPTKTWEEWYAMAREWPVMMIMRNCMAEGRYVDYWTHDWVYCVKSNGKHFYLHMVDRQDYDLMDAFDIPHLNVNRTDVIDALGWEESKHGNPKSS